MKIKLLNETLFGRFVKWLIIPLIIFLLVHLASVYSHTKSISTELFDRVLINTALSLSQYAISSDGDILAVDLLDIVRKTTNDKLYYQVLGPNGSFLVGYHDFPEPPNGLKQIDNHIELYSMVYHGQPIRAVAVSMHSKHTRNSGWTKTFVGQTIEDRNRFIWDEIFENFFRIFIFIVILVTFIYISINIELRPLTKLLNSLKNRDIHDLTPIKHNGMPKELRALAIEINDLFNRLIEQIGHSKRFVENASHQLLTPISALTLQCDRALRQNDTEKMHHSLNRVKINAQRISRMAHQLLQLSYTEFVAFEENKNKTIDLSEIATQCSDEFCKLPESPIVNLNLQHAYLNGNEILLREMLNNLLDNAQKYGGDDKLIIIETAVVNGESIIKVIDRGPGISLEFRDLVTQRFFRVNNDAADGSGLGLAIVHETVLVHHGKMKISSGIDSIGTCIQCGFPSIDTNQQHY